MEIDPYLHIYIIIQSVIEVASLAFNVLTQLYVARSHILALMSAEQDAKLVPAASKASPVTASVWPDSKTIFVNEVVNNKKLPCEESWLSDEFYRR